MMRVVDPMKGRVAAALGWLALAAVVFLTLELVGAVSKPVAWTLAVVALVVVVFRLAHRGPER